MDSPGSKLKPVRDKRLRESSNPKSLTLANTKRKVRPSNQCCTLVADPYLRGRTPKGKSASILVQTHPCESNKLIILKFITNKICALLPSYHPNDMDTIAWSRINDGNFTIESTYESLQCYEFSLDNPFLKRKRLSLSQSNLCKGCDTHVKDLFHLFQDCNAIKLVSKWNLVDHGEINSNLNGLVIESSRVLRDKCIVFICGFCANLGACSILSIELWGILYGIRLAWEKGFRKIRVFTISISSKDKSLRFIFLVSIKLFILPYFICNVLRVDLACMTFPRRLHPVLGYTTKNFTIRRPPNVHPLSIEDLHNLEAQCPLVMARIRRGELSNSVPVRPDSPLLTINPILGSWSCVRLSLSDHSTEVLWNKESTFWSRDGSSSGWELTFCFEVSHGVGSEELAFSSLDDFLIDFDFISVFSFDLYNKNCL
ncbi:hypothetical protein CR513_06351, partial [Mucuna pruriens]